MNKLLKVIGIITLVASIGFSTTSCGGDSPKGLAKQVNEAFPKARDGDEAARKKIEEINKKLDKLSKEERKVYNDELQRLMKR